MGRTVVRRVEPPPSRRLVDGGMLLGAGVVLAFALIGVISAALFIGGRLSATPAPKHHGTSSAVIAAQDIARARAQATAIVKAAENSGRSIRSRQVASARKQAAGIVTQAKATAAHIVAAAQAAAAQAPQPAVQQPAPVAPVAPQPAAPAAPSQGATSGGSSTVPSSPTSPNLSGVPASWLVVAYNATFGSGPGSAGSISVVNRSSTTFSGVAEVIYEGAHGDLGTSSAPFSGLGPGQAEVLPLNGAAYPAGATGYRIEVVNLH